MTSVHEVRFPRFHDDVVTRRRTIFHMPVDGKTWTVGEALRLAADQRCPPRTWNVPFMVGVLTDVRQVRLLAELDADLASISNVDRAAYLARWDTLHPALPSIADPIVWRIAFRYGEASDLPDPPEWGLAA